MSNSINTTLFRFVLGMTHKALADIPEEKMRNQPAAGMNPPAWILGHLCFALNGAYRLLGQPSMLPDEYSTWFGPGSKLEALPSQLPTKKEMLSHMSQIGEMILAALTKVTDADLAKPHGMRLLKEELKTKGDLLQHLLFTHQSIHIGQLTVWRRLSGFPSLIQI